MTRPVWLLTVFLLSVSASAHAAVFERDWQTPGDGLLTFDDMNNREWLDVPESLLATFGGFDFVIAETAPGGILEGFSPATSEDVFALTESAGININSTSLAVNEIPARHLIGLLGDTVDLPGDEIVSTMGILDEVSKTTPTSRLVASFVVVPPTDGAGVGVFPFSEINLDRPFNVVGVMLFRQIPEPPTYLITMSAIACLLVVAIRRRQISTTKF